MVRLSAVLSAILPAALLPFASGAKILLAGDSTMAYSSSALRQGWGSPFAKYVNLNVVNLARGGRSARSYTREGLFDALVQQIDAGDYVVIEFGHNDGGSPATSDRAPVAGTGTATQVVTLADGTVETVQTFVTYERNMVAAVLAKGGIPIISSQTPNGDAWNAARTAIGTPPRFVGYAEVAADQSDVVYMDHWKWTAIAYEDLGYSAVYPTFFPQDHTHTNPAGADVVAKAFVNGLNCIGHPLASQLTSAGRAIPRVCS